MSKRRRLPLFEQFIGENWDNVKTKIKSVLSSANVGDPLRFTDDGPPGIEVTINGKKVTFWNNATPGMEKMIRDFSRNGKNIEEFADFVVEELKSIMEYDEDPENLNADDLLGVFGLSVDILK